MGGGQSTLPGSRLLEFFTKKFNVGKCAARDTLKKDGGHTCQCLGLASDSARVSLWLCSGSHMGCWGSSPGGLHAKASV